MSDLDAIVFMRQRGLNGPQDVMERIAKLEDTCEKMFDVFGQIYALAGQEWKNTHPDSWASHSLRLSEDAVETLNIEFERGLDLMGNFYQKDKDDEGV